MMNEQVATLTDVEKKKRRLKRILYTLAVLFLILLLALLYYLFTQRPLTRVLPGTPKQGPRFVKSIFGNFTDLRSVAVNRRGDKFFVVDKSALLVWMISRDGTILGNFGKAGGPGIEDGWGEPLDIAVSPKDEVYVTDRMGARVLVWSPTGKFLRRFRPADPNFSWSPLAVAVDNQNNVYIADVKQDMHRVLKFDSKGKLLMSFGKQGFKPGEFSYPNGIAVDKAGNIYVADSDNARVQIFNKKGKLVRTFSGTGGSALTHPLAIDVSRNNEIHVVEGFGHDVQVYDYNGGSLYNFGRFGIGDGQFEYPKGIAIAPDGRLFVTDHDNNRIEIWQY